MPGSPWFKVPTASPMAETFYVYILSNTHHTVFYTGVE